MRLVEGQLCGMLLWPLTTAHVGQASSYWDHRVQMLLESLVTAVTIAASRRQSREPKIGSKTILRSKWNGRSLPHVQMSLRLFLKVARKVAFQFSKTTFCNEPRQLQKIGNFVLRSQRMFSCFMTLNWSQIHCTVWFAYIAGILVRVILLIMSMLFIVVERTQTVAAETFKQLKESNSTSLHERLTMVKDANLTVWAPLNISWLLMRYENWLCGVSMVCNISLRIFSPWCQVLALASKPFNHY